MDKWETESERVNTTKKKRSLTLIGIGMLFVYMLFVAAIAVLVQVQFGPDLNNSLGRQHTKTRRRAKKSPPRNKKRNCIVKCIYRQIARHCIPHRRQFLAHKSYITQQLAIKKLHFWLSLL